MTDRMLASAQALRIESLGDNCELGFVLRHLGVEAGSLFRWAAMKPEQLLMKLRADFDGMYEFANLSPLRPAMVLDARYGIGWHTEMRSEPVQGRLRFRDDEESRRAIYLKEARKIRYLISKFVARTRMGGVLFVIKSNAGIAESTVDSILTEMRRISGGQATAILEMRSTDDVAQIGSVDWTRDGVLRGFTSRFAPYEKANEADMAAWRSVLERALVLYPCPDWTTRLNALNDEVTDGSIALAFPVGNAQGLSASHDRAGGSAPSAGILANGNEWCRRISGAFRIHGPDPRQSPATLTWDDVAVAGSYHLGGSAKSSIPEAAPVTLTIRVIASGQREIARQEVRIRPGTPGNVGLEFDPGGEAAVRIEVAASAANPLKS
jgi:hypothetical protein